MKVRAAGGGSSPVTSLRVVSDEIHTLAFSFDAETGLSSATLSTMADPSVALRGLCRLSQNGVDGWRLVDARPDEPNTWRLRGAVIDLRGNVTGPDWSVFRVTYPSAL